MLCFSETLLKSLKSSEAGPSHIGPPSRTFPRLGGCAQRPDSHSSIPSSGFSIERKSVESSTTETKSRRVQIVPTNPVPQRRAAVRYTPPAESVIDLTLDHPGPSAEEHTARWSTFRSGYVAIPLLPLCSNARTSSPEASTDQRPSTDQAPAQVVGQCKDALVVLTSNTNPHSVPVYSSEDYRVTGSLSEHHHQHDVLEAASSSYPRAVILEGEAEMLPSPPDRSPLIHAFASACGNLPLPLGPHDKPRRILHAHDSIYIVTAHGIIDQVGTSSVLQLDHNIRSPSLPYEELVDDACILYQQGDPVIILGHAREQGQIALLSMGHGQVNTTSSSSLALSDDQLAGSPTNYTAP